MGVNASSFSTEVSHVRKRAGYTVKRIWSFRCPLQGLWFPLDFLGSSDPFPLNSDLQFLSNIIFFFHNTSWPISSLKKETVCSLEMLVLSYRTIIWCHNLKDHNMYLHLCNTINFTVRFLCFIPHKEQELHLCVHLSLQNMYICANTIVRVNTHCSCVSFHWRQKINILSLLDVKHWYFNFTCDIPLCVNDMYKWNEYQCQHNCIFTRKYILSIRHIHSVI